MTYTFESPTASGGGGYTVAALDDGSGVGPSVRLLNRCGDGGGGGEVDVIVIHSLITTCLPVVTCFTAAAAPAAAAGRHWWRCALLWRLTQRTAERTL